MLLLWVGCSLGSQGCYPLACGTVGERCSRSSASVLGEGTVLLVVPGQGICLRAGREWLGAGVGEVGWGQRKRVQPWMGRHPAWRQP